MNVEVFHEFIVLAEELNYRSAARRLCMTPSTLSKHISGLESHYRTRLFDRDKSHVSLTSRGVLLLESALTIQDEYERSVTLMEQAAQGTRTLFVSGILDNPSEFFTVSRALEHLRWSGKDLSVHFLPCVSVAIDAQAALLRSGDADCAVINMTEEMVQGLEGSEDFEYRLIRKQPFDAVISADSVLAEHDELKASDLNGCTLVQLVGPRLTPSWKQIEQQLQAAGVQYRTRPIPASSAYDYLNLDPGDGVLLSIRTTTPAPPGSNSRTVRIPLRDEDLSLNLCALYLKSRRSSSVDTLVDVLIDCFNG